MQRVYAKFFLLLILLFSVSGCSGYSAPWGTNTGFWSKDPDSVPNIGWQTQGQRQDLPDRDIQWAGNPVAAPTEPVTKEEIAAPRPKIVVSLLVPLSGAKSALGQSMLKAAQMALFDISAPNVSLVPRDTKGTAAGAAAAAQAAVDAHSALILGPVFAEDLKAVKPIAAAANIPVVSFSTDWTLAGGNTYIMGFLPFTQVLRVVKYAQDHGSSRLAVYAPQTEYCDAVIGTLDKTSISIIRTSRYPTAQHDLALPVKEFANAAKSGDGFDFDTLLLPLGSEGLRNLVTTLGNNGVTQQKVKFIGTGLWDDPTLYGNPALFGGWFSAPDPALRADFERRYRENYGAGPLRLASLAYDATALAAVLGRTATEPGDAYTTGNLTNPRGFAGIDGIFRFRTDGISERGLAVLEMRAGGPKVVDPAPTAFIEGGS